jgi:competence protein ComEC
LGRSKIIYSPNAVNWGDKFYMKRPAVFICLFYLMGLLIGYYVKDFFIIIVLFFSIILLSIILYKTYSWKILVAFPLICFFAYLNINGHLIEREQTIDQFLIKDTVSSNVEGYITDINIIDDKVQLTIGTNTIKISNKVYNNVGKIKAYGKDTKNINIGDYISVNGSLKKLTRPTNEGQFDEEKYYRVRGIKYKLFLKEYRIIENKPEKLWMKIIYPMKQYLYNIRFKANKIYDNVLPSNEANVMKAMILGEKSYLSIDTKNKYSESGISHILAISGLHIAILGYGFYWIICLLLSKKKGVIVTIVFLILYCILTGSSVSTVRAVIMLSIVLLAYLFGRSYDILSSISMGALILLVVNPFYLWDVGFLLSFTAVLGIVLIKPSLDILYNQKRNNIISTLNVSLAATLGTMPVIIYYFYELHLYAALVNVLVVPLMTIVVLFGFVVIITGIFSVSLAKIFAGVVFYILKFYDFCCEVTSNMPYHNIIIGKPRMINLLLLIAFLILLVILNVKKYKDKYTSIKKYMGILFLVFIIVNSVFLILPKSLKVTHLDIGEGDSAVIISPSKEVFVVDGGGTKRKGVNDKDTGYYILRPYLKYNGISKINCLIMTHSDRDHIGGLIELIDCFKVDKLIIPYAYKNKTEDDYLLKELLAKANKKKVNIIYIKEGDVIKGRDISLESLFPLNDTTVFHNNNAYSLVLKLKYKCYKQLLTGDIEKEEEHVINENIAYRIKSDIIKVPHHGSKTSSTQKFIENVMPQIAIISAGRGNSYGHPHKEVVKRYNEFSIPIFNTSEDGAITISTDGNNIGISTYYSNRHKCLRCQQ